MRRTNQHKGTAATRSPAFRQGAIIVDQLRRKGAALRRLTARAMLPGG